MARASDLLVGIFLERILTGAKSRTILVLLELLAMEIIRRDTDYALRAVVTLAGQTGPAPISVATIANQQQISYQLAGKILQRLQKARLVRSQMGAKGGFRLAISPDKISLLDVIEAIQGRLTLNRCVARPGTCNRSSTCQVSRRLAMVEQVLRTYLARTSIKDLLEGQSDGHVGSEGLCT